MTKPNFEIEIKSLLGGKDQADALVNKLQTDPTFRSLGAHKQLNHYFTGGNLESLNDKLSKYFAPSQLAEFRELCEKAKDFSVRTRLADGKVLLVVKASVDDTTSSNGTARQEFEAELDNLKLDELDKLILDSGLRYQAKWSRERQDFKFRGMNVSVDKNAGYGHLAEFEKLADDAKMAGQIKSEIRAAMSELGVEELSQERLARMFDYYNRNWQDYYGTDKVFKVE